MSRYDHEKGIMVNYFGYPGRGDLIIGNTYDRYHTTNDATEANLNDRTIETATDNDRARMTEHQATSAYYSRQPCDF